MKQLENQHLLNKMQMILLIINKQFIIGQIK